ncbi:MAG: FAD-linked oxidase C-terminal domain-containing protein [Bacteroidales bacterium]|nr:FAD-linked oxidase C-terminal domain-containing protein [Bacteroidales bacterium]
MKEPDFSLLNIKGELYTDSLHKIAYATDASAYREMPMAVALPLDVDDLKQIIRFANQHNITIIPRAAGTSLAGQVVGNGIVVDISKYMNKILEVNQQEHWVRLQPGVVRDELNMAMKPYGLFFAPETSTSNRCCVGGMVGNNSCGTHSLRYGSTREHLISANVILSDGTETVFEPLTPQQVSEKCQQNNLEGEIYRQLTTLLANESTRELLRNNYPTPELTRRNNGYALDLLMYNSFFDPSYNQSFNLCKLLAGSEGTLAFVTELKLNLEPLPPKERMVLCVHCNTLEEAFEGNLVALQHSPVAVELMDDKILELSEKSPAQRANRFFVEGHPKAILIAELVAETKEQLHATANDMEQHFRQCHIGYAFPRVFGADVSRVWALRKAGLGILGNMVGDAKPTPVIEDTAVAPKYLPAYMADFQQMLRELHLECVYYAHIGTGELHLRPVLNMKSDDGVKAFRQVAQRTAELVKKYRGSLSGEHGDGRLRGEFIPLMLGSDVYNILCDVKRWFDPNNLFNKGKIVNTPPMDSLLRYRETRRLADVATYFDFSDRMGWMRAVELCTGAGDCRRSQLFGEVMCPVFRATHNETQSTRARANVMRELLIEDIAGEFNHPEILEVLDDCLLCKACRRECPSGVNITKLKAEYLQHHFDKCGTPLSTWLIGNLPTLQKMVSVAPFLYNFAVTNTLTSSLIRSTVHFTSERPLPKLAGDSLTAWLKKQPKRSGRVVYLFADEFTNLTDVEVGKAFVQLLWHFGFNVVVPNHVESGRTFLSKGMLKKAQKVAAKNVALLADVVSEETPLVGLEPSAILSFRDEYPVLLRGKQQERAKTLSNNVFLYDEFICKLIDEGVITANHFTDAPQTVYLHGHCHQKSLASVEPSRRMLDLPKNYTVKVIPSGCCGMAGAFGYEKRHYELSMKIGEQTLFPAVRASEKDALIAAPGTSCREQIMQGTQRCAKHPVELLFDALK